MVKPRNNSMDDDEGYPHEMETSIWLGLNMDIPEIGFCGAHMVVA